MSAEKKLPPLKQIIFILLLFFMFFYYLKTPSDRYISLHGFTMGTTWNVTCRFSQKELLQKKIEQRLVLVNSVMSTYIETSEISILNKTYTTSPISLSADLFSLARDSIEISKATSGLYDVTISPLIRLWGFDFEKIRDLPDLLSIQKVLKKIGYQNLIFLEGNSIQKRIAELEINLSSIAKGYGVDQVAILLEEFEIFDYLVEIGGELRVKGLSPREDFWHVGINSPKEGAALDEVVKILKVSNFSVATSGNYRNFKKDGEKHYGHILDPRTGYTGKTDVLSATILTKECAIADGWATAAMLMGTKQASKILEEYKLFYFLIYTDEQGKIQTLKNLPTGVEVIDL